MRINQALRASLVTAALFLGLASLAHAAGSATNINGLYYTGVNNTYGLIAGGSQDSHWSVTYADVNGTAGNTAYQGAAYVVKSNYIDAGWTQNTGSAQWIVPPGASTAQTGGMLNAGGDYLPGNGTTGTNAAQYIYTLAFTISGTGGAGATVGNNISISLTLAADDQYKVYVNPTLNGNGSIYTGNNGTATTASATRTSAWNNTTAIYLQNYANSNGSANASFVIGTNYITVVVDNTNSQTGTSGSNALNPSGLIVYQVGSAMTIDGNPVPEVGTWLPVVGAVGLFALRRFRRRADGTPSVA